uniref:PNPLA domain-containing protein n=1 Tax=viral metagenome TaxID=1070528 RepID=A0A6C0IDW6_9ZZZZ
MPHYDTLVLSGGAVKGFALLGALQYAMDHGFLLSVHKYVGTSIGAILSYLLCIGYTPVELMVLLCQNQWLGKLHLDVYNIVQGSGALSFSHVQEILEKLTVQKIGHFMTLRQLQEKYGKTLICCTYNYTLDREEFMTPADHPDLPCLTALRMSANLPLVFEPFLYNGSVYLDGGLSSNFPLHYCGADDKVLGIALFPTSPSEPDHIPSSLELLWKTLTIPMSLLQTLRTQAIASSMDVLEIRVDGYFCLQFDIGNNEKFDMFSTGYNTAKTFYERDGKSVHENTLGGGGGIGES